MIRIDIPEDVIEIEAVVDARLEEEGIERGESTVLLMHEEVLDALVQIVTTSFVPMSFGGPFVGCSYCVDGRIPRTSIGVVVAKPFYTKEEFDRCFPRNDVTVKT